MKNKKLVYVLLVLSVFVWGWIVLKVVHAFTGDASSDTIKKKKASLISYKPIKDSFSLLLNYDDPFYKRNLPRYNYGDGLQVARPNISKKNKVFVQKEKAPVQIIDWSFIQFKGTIKRNSTGKTLALLNVSGRDYSIEEGREIEKVLLVKNCKDSILVKYNGISQYIKKH